MDCMQFAHLLGEQRGRQVSIPQAVWIACNKTEQEKAESVALFQYRKRYGLHAISHRQERRFASLSFNTASGMDCMQFQFVNHLTRCLEVSIPQAVWIACNVLTYDPRKVIVVFQYRKRYGLHAMS